MPVSPTFDSFLENTFLNVTDLFFNAKMILRGVKAYRKITAIELLCDVAESRRVSSDKQ